MISKSVWLAWIQRLRAAIGCPIDWTTFPTDDLVRKALRLYWVEIATEYDVYGEMRYYKQLDAAIRIDEEELKRVEINSTYWRQRASAKYCDRVAVIRTLRFASRSEHSKHFAPPGMSVDQIIERTKNRRPALFFPTVDQAKLTDMLGFGAVCNWRLIAEKRPSSLYIRDNDSIGASSGQETNCARFDLEGPTGLVHGHPILATEKPSDAPWADEAFREDTFFIGTDQWIDHDIDEPWAIGTRDDVEDIV